MNRLMMALLGTSALVMAPADGGAGGAGFFDEAAGADTQAVGGDDTQPGGAGDDTAAGGGDDTQPGGAADRPEWLLDKYKTPEDQAKAYRDLYGRFSKKTDLLRDEVKAEVLAEAGAEYGKSIGVPDDVAGYAYPVGFEPPAEAVDQSLRAWAKKHNVSPEGFHELVRDVHGQTVANHAAEKEKLGKSADERVARVNRWIGANVDKAHFGQVRRVMTTAEGVAFIEHIMGVSAESGFAPGDGNNANPALTREDIRAMQADPKFGTDDAYTAKVRKAWADFAARQKK
jgi:hypothetical protein